MVTDKNWFKENILCLLSNAVKYSHGGKVSLTITHISKNLQVHVSWEEENEKQKDRDEENLKTKDLNENGKKLSDSRTTSSQDSRPLSRLSSFGNYQNTYPNANTDTDADGDVDILTDVRLRFQIGRAHV